MSVAEKTNHFDRIEVHTPEILDEIRADNGRSEPYLLSGSSWHRPCYMSAPMPKTSSRTSVSTKSASPSRLHGRLSQYPGCRFQSWLNEDFVKDIQEKSDNESRSIRNMCNAVLDNEEALCHDVDQYIKYSDISNGNRRRMLFKKWSEKVYTPLKEKIDVEMNSPHYEDHVKKKRNLYQKYLEYRNKKGMVFLDVYSQEEYDPLQLNNPRPGPLKARVPSLDKNDPLCFQDFKRIVEEQETLRCRTGLTMTPDDIRRFQLPEEPLVPLGRENTSCKTWLRMPIHDIDSPPRLKSRQKMRYTTNHSQIDFNKWQSTAPNIPSVKLVDLELHSQKKRYYPEKYVGRQILQWPEGSKSHEETILTEVA